MHRAAPAADSDPTVGRLREPGSGAVAQLPELARIEMGSQRAGDVAKTGLPQHSVVEQALDQNHFRIGLSLRP